MKRFLFGLLGLTLIFAGCSPQDEPPVQEPPTQTPQQLAHLPFAAQAIRTNGYDESRRYPIITLITNVNELKAYIDAHEDEYDLNGFAEASEAYDDAFFEDLCLALVVLEEFSGSVRHEVEQVVSDDAAVRIQIVRHLPQMGTADMAQWHIIVELPAHAANAALSVTTREAELSIE